MSLNIDVTQAIAAAAAYADARARALDAVQPTNTVIDGWTIYAKSRDSDGSHIGRVSLGLPQAGVALPRTADRAHGWCEAHGFGPPCSQWQVLPEHLRRRPQDRSWLDVEMTATMRGYVLRAAGEVLDRWCQQIDVDAEVRRAQGLALLLRSLGDSPRIDPERARVAVRMLPVDVRAIDPAKGARGALDAVHDRLGDSRAPTPSRELDDGWDLGR